MNTPPDPSNKTARYKYAADQATAVMGGQLTDASSFQSRAQAILSAAAVTTTVIGSVAKAGLFGTQGTTNLLEPWELLVIAILFGLTVVAALLCMWPRGGWEFQLEPTELVAAYDRVDPDTASDADVYRNACVNMSVLIAGNTRKMNVAIWSLRSAQLLLGLQILFFVLVVWGRA